MTNAGKQFAALEEWSKLRRPLSAPAETEAPLKLVCFAALNTPFFGTKAS
jgi:hypothetical protein